jgi:hypothetical protein
VKVDYSGGKQNPDYLAASKAHHNGKSGEVDNLKDYLVDGKVTETRSYLRWENPALSQNGEGRISPTIPGCQVTLTVIGKDGKALLQNHIWKLPDVEDAGKEGVNSIVMSPVQPHTISKKSRTCESCHSDAKAMGYGINSGAYFADPSKTTIVDLMDTNQSVLPSQIDEQIPATPNLHHDYSVMINKNGKQVQTVGNHWKLSGALDNETRAKLDRRGMCLSCHQEIPKGNLAVSAMTHAANMAGVKIDNKMHGNILHKLLNIGAWVQVLIPIMIGVLALWFFFFRRKK